MSEPTFPPPQQSPTEVTEDEKLLAVLSYVPILCLIPYLRSDRTEFVSTHVRLGMTLFVIEIFALILRYLRVVWDVIILLCVIAAIAGIVNGVRGRLFSLPYLSDLFSKKY